METGQTAPLFSLPADNGDTFALEQQKEKRTLLVFYPGDDTPVCTRQLCDYRDGIEVFSDLGVEVIGISRDNADKHKRFKDKHQLPFTLLTDDKLEVAKQYGCAGMLGMRRGVFLVDESLIIRYAHVEAVALFRRRREELVEAIKRLD